MTIAYACDMNYAALTAISAVSALRHNPGARIALLGLDLAPEARELVRSRVEEAGGSFAYHDLSAELNRLKESGCSGYTSFAAYARIFIPSLIGDERRVIYLDCDTLVNGPLEALLSFDMQGKPLALGMDCIVSAYKRYVNAPTDRPYCNSGVLLMDVERWRERKCTERMLAELACPHGPNPLGDQDIIVRCLADDIVLLPPKWNFLSQFFIVSYRGLARIVGAKDGLHFSEDEYLDGRRNAAIYHFSGHTLGRPWFTSSRHPLRSRYLKAARDAGLEDAAMQTRTMATDYMAQYLLWRFLPQPLFDTVCRWMYRLHIRRCYGV